MFLHLNDKNVITTAFNCFVEKASFGLLGFLTTYFSGFILDYVDRN